MAKSRQTRVTNALVQEKSARDTLIPKIDGLEVCGQIAMPVFRSQAEGRLTPCCNVPQHKGNHVYCLKITRGTDSVYALHYVEELHRGELKAVMLADLTPCSLTDEECAALWQYFELFKSK